MNTVFKLTLKSALRDPYLLFWSILLPIGGTAGLSLYMQTPTYTQVILTGMMAVSILFYSLMTTSYTVLGHRRRGVYNLLRVTPMTLSSYIFSISSAWTLISVACGLMLIATGVYWLGLQLSLLSILMLVPMMIIGAIGYVFFSFCISAISKTEGNISIITNILTLPLMLCSSAFYSLRNAPLWIQKISHYNPFQWFVNGLRSSLSLDWQQYFTSLLLLCLCCVVALLLAITTFKYRES